MAGQDIAVCQQESLMKPTAERQRWCMRWHVAGLAVLAGWSAAGAESVTLPTHPSASAAYSEVVSITCLKTEGTCLLSMRCDLEEDLRRGPADAERTLRFTIAAGEDRTIRFASDRGQRLTGRLLATYSNFGMSDAFPAPAPDGRRDRADAILSVLGESASDYENALAERYPAHAETPLACEYRALRGVQSLFHFGYYTDPDRPATPLTSVASSHALAPVPTQ